MNSGDKKRLVQKTRPRRDKDWKCEFIDLLTKKKKTFPIFRSNRKQEKN